jgi:prevent-host-death family protein
MLDIKNSIRSLTEFKQNSSDTLKYIKKTHSPAILTINGKAAAVLLDPKSYQEMVNKIALAESANLIKLSLMEMENDEGIEPKKAFNNLRKKFTKK